MTAKMFILLNLYAARVVEMIVKKDKQSSSLHYFAGIVNRIAERAINSP